MADGVPADEMADFLGEILSVIAGALEGLGHEDDLQASHLLPGVCDGVLQSSDFLPIIAKTRLEKTLPRRDS